MTRTAGIQEAIDDAGGVTPPPRQSALALGVSEQPAQPALAFRAGRPPGARNRRTEEFRAELAAMGALPGVFLGELIRDYKADRAALGQRLGVEPAVLLVNVMRAVDILMPYSEQQLPKDLNIEGKGAMLFQLINPAGMAGLESEEDQGLISIHGGQVGQPPVGQDDASV